MNNFTYQYPVKQYFGNNDFARGELMWDSAMAENSMLKLGKITDFQGHMIEPFDPLRDYFLSVYEELSLNPKPELYL